MERALFVGGTGVRRGVPAEKREDLRAAPSDDAVGNADLRLFGVLLDWRQRVLQARPLSPVFLIYTSSLSVAPSGPLARCAPPPAKLAWLQLFRKLKPIPC